MHAEKVEKPENEILAMQNYLYLEKEGKIYAKLVKCAVSKIKFFILLLSYAPGSVMIKQRKEENEGTWRRRHASFKKAQAISPSLTLGINALSTELKAQGKDVVGFGVGEPDFDTPAYIRQAAIDAIESGKTRYTAVPGIMELRQAVCDRYEHKYGLKYAPAQVVVSNGAKECLLTPSR